MNSKEMFDHHCANESCVDLLRMSSAHVQLIAMLLLITCQLLQCCDVSGRMLCTGSNTGRTMSRTSRSEWRCRQIKSKDTFWM